MRKRFEQVHELDAMCIPDVKIDKKSRHELPQLLAGLQYIFVTPSLNEKVFKILEDKILSSNNHTGRLGMSLWEILVLGTMRLNLDIDYDFLHDQANHHLTVRGILGVYTKQVFGEGKYYELQTIKDNVALLDELTLQEISEVVVKAGHSLKKNIEEDLVLNLKSDSYAVESNVHFPTDINLLWDSGRKCLDMIVTADKHVGLQGWRKLMYWMKKLKKSYRRVANIHQKKGKGYHERLQRAASQYLVVARELDNRVVKSLEELKSSPNVLAFALEQRLNYFQKMLCKHIDLLERRIIKGEKIPHAEKIFSIFEPHVEWNQKGKANNKVELGHNVLLTTDQYHFIVDHKVMVGESDTAQPIDLLSRLEERFKEDYKLASISFDRGFYSALAKKALEKKIENVIIPFKGKKTSEQTEQENEQTFKAFRNKHSAVESNINELEHTGVNKVPDKGLTGFKKYVAMGVLAYNIRRLGKIVIAQKLINTLIEPKGFKRAA